MHVPGWTHKVTNEQRLEEALKLILQVQQELVPNDPVIDIYYLQIGMTVDRLFSGIHVMQRFVDEFNRSESSK